MDERKFGYWKEKMESYTGKEFRINLELNNTRFRVKNMPEGSPKIGVFLSHLGLGDLIFMNGAIRYSALMVDKLYVVCKSKYCNTIKEIFSDNPSVCILECRDDDSDVLHNMSMLKEIVTHSFLSGYWGGYSVDSNNKDISLQFYENLGFPIEIKRKFAYFNSTSSIEIPDVPYIFTHSSSSTTYGKFLDFKDKWNTDEILTIDPNNNIYPPGHKWHILAESYINLPTISRYVKLIENADEIHVTDSSFYSLASLISTKATKKVCYDRHSGIIVPHYNFT